MAKKQLIKMSTCDKECKKKDLKQGLRKAWKCHLMSKEREKYCKI